MPKPSRIAFLIPSMERGYFWHPLLAAITERFPTTTVYTARWPGFRAGYEDTFHVVPVATRAEARGEPVHRGRFRIPVFALLVRLARHRPHVLLSSAFSMWTLLAVALKPIARWRIIVLYEGSSPEADKRTSLLNMVWRRLLVLFIDAYVTNTEGGRTYLTDHLHVARKKVKRVLYQVPAPEFFNVLRSRREVGTLRFITVGRLTALKGLTFFFQAASLVEARHGPSFTITIVGEGDDRAALTRYARVRLNGTVEWRGRQPHHLLHQQLETADVFVFPSLMDNVGLPALEAMAAGLPVICSQHAGAAEYVNDGVDGYVVDPFDVEAFADRMIRFIEEPTLSTRMGTRSRAAITPHSLERAVAVFEDLVQSLSRGRDGVGTASPGAPSAPPEDREGDASDERPSSHNESAPASYAA